MIRVGVDTGGTFTDIAIFDGRRLIIGKTATTPHDPSVGIASGIRTYLPPTHTDQPIQILGHGTTIGTNVLLQQQLPPTALITTRGFKDVIEIGRQKRLGLYDLDVRKPNVSVPRDMRFEVTERIAVDGTVHQPIDLSELKCICKQLQSYQDKGLISVAVGFLHSYQNPSHEIAAENLLRKFLGDDFVICRSSSVLPVFREYERFSSTVVNAALVPILQPYLEKLEKRLEEQSLTVQNIFITQSDGMLLQAHEIAMLPIRSVLSGPSSGVVGAKALMEKLGEQHYITVDMGGTSTDICAVQNGKPLVRKEANIGGYIVSTSALDIHTIGAGGGSIAYMDNAGHLKVGPESAGAVPGPAAYGSGGKRPTVTDANVALGYLRPDNLLAGSLRLDYDAAIEALAPLSEQLQLSIENAAEGIIAVEVSNMERAVRTLVAGRGIDIREYSLVVFGGAGPLLASRLARSLRAREVIIPTYPGILCAVGLLVADMSREFAETKKYPLTADGIRQGRTVLERLKVQGLQWCSDSGLSALPTNVLSSVDMRYVGQNYEISIDIPEPIPDNIQELEQLFQQQHQLVFGFSLDRPIEFVTWKVTTTIELPKYDLSDYQQSRKPETVLQSPIYVDGKWVEALVLTREALAPHSTVHGPAVIQQMDSTTVLLPNDIGTVDEYGNLHVREEDVAYGPYYSRGNQQQVRIGR